MIFTALIGIMIWSAGDEIRRKKYIRGVVICLLLPAVSAAAIFHAGQLLQKKESYLPYLTEGETISVCGELYKKEYKNEKYRYYLKNCALQFESNPDRVCEGDCVIAYTESDAFCLGDTLTVVGTIFNFNTAVDDGMFDMKSYYASLGIDFAITGCRISLWQRPAWSVPEVLYRLRQQLCNVTEYYFTEEKAGILNSILFGDKSQLDSEVKSLYQNAGISHILAISGLHVSMIGMALYRLLRKVHCSYISSALLAAGVLAGYTMMTGSGISTMRAAGMLMLTMAGSIAGRRTDAINSLGLMIILLLWQNPWFVLNSSFIFSAMAILGITVTAKLLQSPNTDRSEPGEFCLNPMVLCASAGRYLRRNFRENLHMSLAISLTTLPLTVWYYYEFPLYSVFLNLLVLPLMTLLFLSGLGGTVIGLLPVIVTGRVTISLIARILYAPASWILSLLKCASGICMQLPGAQQITGRPAIWKMFLYYGILGSLLFYQWYKKEVSVRSGKKSRKEKAGRGQMIVVTGLLICLIMLPPVRNFEIDILDVGQGDGIYCCTENGTSFFIDGGSVTEDQVGTYRILPFLKYHGLRELDYWFVSHGDEDHISGLLEVLDSGYRVKRLVLSAEMPEDEAYEELLAAAQSAGTQVLFMKQGDILQMGNASLTCIYPGTEEGELFTDRNDLSLTLLLDQTRRRDLLQILTGAQPAHYRALFAGDLSSEAEEVLVKKGLVGDVDLYKVCHHGSRYSSSSDFLNVLKPETAVISCGLKNTYGHPAAEAVKRIEASGADIYYTMYSGQITVH